MRLIGKRMMLLVMALIFMFQGVMYAASDLSDVDSKKPRVALLYVNNAKTTYDDEINTKMMDNFNAQLTNYIIVSGAPYIEKLNKVGISDITTAERADIVEAFKGDDVDYVLYAEVQPFVRKERWTMFSQGIDMTAIIPVKIIDLKGNKYLYNGKFTEFASDSTMIGMVGNKSVSMKALNLTIEKMNAVIAVRLPQERPAPAQR